MNKETKQRVRVVQVTNEHTIFPMQLMALTDEGEVLYIRYWNDNLTIGKGANEDEAVQNGMGMRGEPFFEYEFMGNAPYGSIPGIIFYNLTKSVIDWSEECLPEILALEEAVPPTEEQLMGFFELFSKKEDSNDPS